MYFINCSIFAKSIVDSDEETAVKAMNRMKKRIEKLSPEIYAEFCAYLMVINEEGFPVKTDVIDNESES